MSEVLTRDEDGSRAAWDAGCGKYGTTVFASQVNAALREGKSVGEAMQIAMQTIEHQCLQSALVEAAIAWNGTRRDTDEWERALVVLGDAVDAFKAENGIGEK